ncbi:MAG: AlpA family phage regulatory protein [Endozoicomonadaceae bacterium]|nr:AlpA family phage regulatory protein [Endozoicomonadaceae bacterium]MCY4329943.1 AlpA family phage regulatory protein [Endozoicomonadaceae bacterium]
MQYLLVKDVKSRYNLSISTLYNWISKGLFPRPVKIGPRAVRWKLSDLEEWEQSLGRQV